MYVSGAEIRIDRNWVGLQGSAGAGAREPASVERDLGGGAVDVRAEFSAAAAVAPGGIQIAGQSRDVLVTDNQIEGGSRNGITLGSFVILDENGIDTGQPTGVLVELEDDCTATGTLDLPGTPTTGPSGRTLVAGGPLAKVTIDRNRIRNMGLCGVGPVGFFPLAETPEVITINDLTVVGNSISNTLLREVSMSEGAVTSLGYGAILVPDVRELVVSDNTITDFGATPSSAVCGIFIFHAETVQLSRNRIVQTRDFDPASTDVQPGPGLRAGILVALVTPPALESPTPTNVFAEGTLAPAPVYETGLPALRVEHNVVRVAIGLGFGAFGLGAFTIVNNSFSSGELIERERAATVQVMNLGVALEFARPATTSRSLYEYTMAAPTELGRSPLGSASDGAVLFTDNICKVKASGDLPTGVSSVFVVSHDHVLFANNHCTVESPKPCLIVDAFLLASTIQVESNRLQEGVGSVLLSGFTAGLMNITSANLSTYCLLATAATAAGLVRVNNLVLVGSEICDRLLRYFGGANVPTEAG